MSQTLRIPHLFARLSLSLIVAAGIIIFLCVFPQVIMGIVKALLIILALFTAVYAFFKIMKWIVLPVIFFLGIGAILYGQTDVFFQGLMDFFKMLFNIG